MRRSRCRARLAPSAVTFDIPAAWQVRTELARPVADEHAKVIVAGYSEREE